MQRLSFFLLVCAAILLVSGCATKKYVRNQVKTSSDTLTARIETNEGQIKEVQDTQNSTDKKVTGVETKVAELDTRTSDQFNSVRTDVQVADQKASKANTAADQAATNVSTLDQKFQNRNQFNATDEKSVLFKFNSATLEPQYTQVLDEIADTLMQNPNALVVLEGRTDSVGTKDYNVKLGERRIDTVRRYLAVEKGVPVYRIHDISFGAEKPIAENKTRDGREKNRAVTMTILVPKTEAVASRN
jgi:outer membrane protein OmpA-like peptidoglycan-associated protein